MNDVAQIGAAIGREFSYELIATVSALPPGELEAALEQLVAAGLIFPPGSASGCDLLLQTCPRTGCGLRKSRR